MSHSKGDSGKPFIFRFGHPESEAIPEAGYLEPNWGTRDHDACGNRRNVEPRLHRGQGLGTTLPSPNIRLRLKSSSEVRIFHMGAGLPRVRRCPTLKCRRYVAVF